ncbi:MAG: anaerobic ribonucleoside-triphosphate reductase activating protein [Thermodesulfobacteriota bacterium]
MQRLKGCLDTSFVDWPGRMCAVLFLAGCNFRCPFCHNHELVLAPGQLPSLPWPEERLRLRSRRRWLGGITVSGGEPTLDPELPRLAAELRDDGWPVKLDTNGSRPEVLEGLLAAGLLDMVAMDVKAPLEPEPYAQAAGVAVDLAAIRASIDLLAASGIPHQFRLTVVPGLHDAAAVRAWHRSLPPSGRRVLQGFRPLTTLDPAFRDRPTFSPAQLDALQAELA